LGKKNVQLTKTGDKKELMSPEVIIQLGRPPVRIDILTSITGVAWKEVWKNRKKGAFGRLQISTYRE